MVKVNISSKKHREEKQQEAAQVISKPNPSFIDESVDKMNKPTHTHMNKESTTTLEYNQPNSFMDAVGQYQFRKVFTLEDNRDQEVIEWSSPNNPFQRKHRSKGLSWKKTGLQILLSSIGAIILGSIMGISVLSIFFNEDNQTSKNSIDSHLVKGDSKSNQDSPTHVSSNTDQVLPPMRVYLLQTGNYMNKEDAQKAVYQFREKGLAAVLSDQSPYQIYLGMSLDAKQANQLVEKMKIDGIVVNPKEINITTKNELSDSLQSLNGVVTIGNQIVQTLTPATVSQLTSTEELKPFPFSLEYLEKHRRFVSESQSVMANMPSSAKESLSEMVRGIDQAIQGAEEAQKNPNSALLGLIQEGLIRYSTSYQQLIQNLNE